MECGFLNVFVWWRCGGCVWGSELIVFGLMMVMWLLFIMKIERLCGSWFLVRFCLWVCLWWWSFILNMNWCCRLIWRDGCLLVLLNGDWFRFLRRFFLSWLSMFILMVFGCLKSFLSFLLLMMIFGLCLIGWFLCGWVCFDSIVFVLIMLF